MAAIRNTTTLTLSLLSTHQVTFLTDNVQVKNLHFLESTTKWFESIRDRIRTFIDRYVHGDSTVGFVQYASFYSMVFNNTENENDLRHVERISDLLDDISDIEMDADLGNQFTFPKPALE